MNVPRSVAPTPLPVRASNSPAPYVPALTTTIRFQNANPATLNTTQGLQQTTAQLACALRVPLENIQIKNITQTVGGQVVAVPYDPTVASMVSNGQIVCFGANATAPVNVTTPRRVLRALTADSSVNVEYVISDPTPAILSMDMTDFSSTLAADPAIVDLALLLGSSGVEAEAPPELALASAAAATGSAPSPAAPGADNSFLSRENAIPIIAGTIAGAAVVSALVAGGFFFVLNKSRASAVTAQKPVPGYKQSPAVVIIESTNPMAAAAAAATANAANAANTPRSAFDPHGVRVGARV